MCESDLEFIQLVFNNTVYLIFLIKDKQPLISQSDTVEQLGAEIQGLLDNLTKVRIFLCQHFILQNIALGFPYFGLFKKGLGKFTTAYK